MTEESQGEVDSRSACGSSDGAVDESHGPSAEDIIGSLDLSPHQEGGYFRETYRAEQKVSTLHGKRAASTAILYLLTGVEPSRFHRLRADELWLYHSGALTELVLLKPQDSAGPGKADTGSILPENKVIGPGSPCVLVPSGWWVAARVIVGEKADWGQGRAPERRWTADRRVGGIVDWTLVTCVVTPGFEYEDFEMAERGALLNDYPLAKELILGLT